MQRYKVNSVWVSGCRLLYDDCIRVIFLEKLKTTEALEYAYQYEHNLSTNLLSTLMTYVKNILNWPDLGGQMMDMTQNYSLWPHKGSFPGKTKINRSTWICSKYNLGTSLLSTLITYLKNILNAPDPGGQMMDMTQNYSLWPPRVIFLEKLKTTEAQENITSVLIFDQLWWHISKHLKLAWSRGSNDGYDPKLFTLTVYG